MPPTFQTGRSGGGPGKILGPTDAAQGLQHSDNHGDTTSSRLSRPPLASLSPSPPFWDLGVTVLAHLAPASENYEKAWGSLSPDSCPWTAGSHPTGHGPRPTAPGLRVRRDRLQASALTAHAWLLLSLAHNMPFRPWHKLFPLLYLTLPWLTPTYWEGEPRSYGDH